MKHLIPTFGGTVVGVGGLTYGGFEAYKKLKPATWAEILSAEGYEYINEKMQDDAGQKIWWVLKQKNKDGFLDDITKDKEYSEVKTKCLEKLKSKADRYSNNYSTELGKIKKTCVKEGAKNTREWIDHTIWQQSKDDPKEKFILRDNGQSGGTDEKEEFEIMFAVYRNQHEDVAGIPQFLDWLKGHSDKKTLSETSEISEGGDELKKACKKLFDKSKGTIAPTEHGNYRSGFMWCRKLPYSTIKDKIKLDKNFEEDTDWDGMKTKWEHTNDVKTMVKESGDPTKIDYETFCTNGTGNKKLNEKDAYQKTYLVFKSVCYKKKQT